jgi:hypothetical protein
MGIFTELTARLYGKRNREDQEVDFTRRFGILLDSIAEIERSTDWRFALAAQVFDVVESEFGTVLYRRAENWHGARQWAEHYPGIDAIVTVGAKEALAEQRPALAEVLDSFIRYDIPFGGALLDRQRWMALAGPCHGSLEDAVVRLKEAFLPSAGILGVDGHVWRWLRVAAGYSDFGYAAPWTTIERSGLFFESPLAHSRDSLASFQSRLHDWCGLTLSVERILRQPHLCALARIIATERNNADESRSR